MADQNPAASDPHYLKDFQTIRAPSFNRDSNRNTFAYRLSELIFGSLLASYLLGFISFASSYVQPSAKYQLFPVKAEESIGNIVNDGILKLSILAQLFQINAIDQGIYVNLLLKTVFSWTSILILQHLLISVLFSTFTALLYVNFHQSILYLSLDQRKASLDFIVAILIGIFFGLSMIFPLSTMFWVGLLTLGVLGRKRALLADFGKYAGFRVAEHAGIKFRQGQQPGEEEAERNRILRPILKDLKSLLFESEHPVVKSWGRVSLMIGIGIGLMVSIPFALLAMEAFGGWGRELTQTELKWLIGANTASCALLIAFLLGRLLSATRIMPSQDVEGEAKLDDALNEVFTHLATKVRARDHR